MLVVVGIIKNSQGEILIAQRPQHKFQGGLWEFPGGKLEQGETTYQALQREIFEELNVTVLSAEPWLELSYTYETQEVFLNICKVTSYQGEPVGKENQLIQWVSIPNLSQYTFPPANAVILQHLQQN